MATERTTTEVAIWPTFDDLRTLAREPRGGVRVSIYLDLPERPGFTDLRALAKRYDRAVAGAGAKLEQLGVEPERRRRIVDALSGLELHASDSIEIDSEALPSLRGAVAVLIGPDERPYVAALGRSHVDRVYVGRTYRLRPVLAEVHRNRTFRALALSLHRVQAYEGDLHGIREVLDPRVPRDLLEALGWERGVTPDRIQGWSGDDLPPSQRYTETDLDRFHAGVARALAQVWADRRDPLVLVADETHQGRFSGDARLPGLLAKGVARNSHDLGAAELHRLAWPLAREQYQAEERELASRINEGTTRSGAILELEPAITAVLSGRVSRLWLDEAKEIPGHVDIESGQVLPALADDEVLDDLALLTIAYHGTVAIGRDTIRGDAGLAAELR